MIFIQAKIKCEHSGCERTADIELEFREGSQKIPILSPCDMPEGWKKDIEYGYGFGVGHEVHLCPEHPPKRGY